VRKRAYIVTPAQVFFRAEGATFEISEIFVEINNLRRSRNPEINDLRKAQGPGQPKRPAGQGRPVRPSPKRRRPRHVKEQAARAAPKHTLASLDGNAIKKFNLFFRPALAPIGLRPAGGLRLVLPSTGNSEEPVSLCSILRTLL
jgi:hypothetical protein